MATRTTVTRRDAEQVLAKLRKVFEAYGADDAFIKPGPDEGLREGTWVIAWEGGPYDWPQLFPRGGRDEDFGYNWPAVEIPAHIFAEPLNTWGLGLYPENLA